MISVIIPSYNREKVIAESAGSVLNQTYKDIELIIVDDCSVDHTAEVVNNIHDSRVRYIRHEVNQGACAARNTGIAAARGEYIAFQDSDDVWFSEKLEKQLAVLEKTGADVVFCKYQRMIDGQEDAIGPARYAEGFLDPVISLYGIGTQTIIGRRKVFEEFQFDTDMPRFQEMELLLRISEKYRIYCLDEPLLLYRLGSDSISQNPVKLYKACSMILDKHEGFLKKYPDMGKSMARRLIMESDNLKADAEVEKKDMYKLAIKCDGSVKTYAKVILNQLGLYKIR